MIKKTLLITSLIAAGAFSLSVFAKEPSLSPAKIVAQAKQHEWRQLDLENTLVLTLKTGEVVIELNPMLAPNHVAHFKKLVREDFYADLNMYRFVEGFVAQGGDITSKKKAKTTAPSIAAEFYYETAQPLPIQVVDTADGYASKTGFLNGFSVAQDEASKKTWQTHCTGNFAMARSNDINSGGTEFYIMLGDHRYLDLNITSFGRVVSGMEHVQRLSRKPEKSIEDKNFNPILGFDVAADLKDSPAHNIEVMKTNSASFKDYIASRQNRPEPWFHYQADYMHVCGITVPQRNIKK